MEASIGSGILIVIVNLLKHVFDATTRVHISATAFA